MTKRILITGIYGFLGYHAAIYLKHAGHHVTGIDSGDSPAHLPAPDNTLKYYTAAVTLENLNRIGGGFDCVFHCAGKGSVGYSQDHPLDDFSSNVTTTANVLEYIRTNCRGAKLIIPSSLAVYGNHGERPISTDSPLVPISPYGYHKRIAEELCEYYAKLYSINVGVIRFFSLYGPYLQKQLLWDACLKFQAAGEGPVSFFGTGEETRDWLHVQDAISLMACFSESLQGFSVINGAGGKKMSVRNTLELLAANFEISSGRIRFSQAVKPGDPIHCHADITQALALGWRPMVPLVQGITEYAAWFKEAHA